MDTKVIPRDLIESCRVEEEDDLESQIARLPKAFPEEGEVLLQKQPDWNLSRDELNHPDADLFWRLRDVPSGETLYRKIKGW